MIEALLWLLLVGGGIALAVFAVGAVVGGTVEVLSGYLFRRRLNRRE